MLDPYTVIDPENCDLSSKGHSTKNIFSAVFGTFT
jgi:hypothetical protein